MVIEIEIGIYRKIPDILIEIEIGKTQRDSIEIEIGKTQRDSIEIEIGKTQRDSIEIVIGIENQL
jgi:hypothetical protein